MDNYQIRRAIENDIKIHGGQDTREIIARYAASLKIPKQRVAGNLSCMTCLEKSVNIMSNRPHSIVTTK